MLWADQAYECLLVEIYVEMPYRQHLGHGECDKRQEFGVGEQRHSREPDTQRADGPSPNNDTISSTTTSPANPKEQGTDKKNAQSRPGHEQQYEVAKDPTQARQFEPETSAAATQIPDTVAPLRLGMKDLGENLISRFRHLIRNGRIEGSKVPVALDFDWRSLDTRIKSLRDH